MGTRFSEPVQTGPGAHPASCTMGTGSFPGVKRPGRDADPSPPFSAVVKKVYSYTSTPTMGRTACTEPLCLYSRAIPLLPLWAVQPVQSLSACTVELYLYSPYGPYGLYRTSVPVQGCTLPLPQTDLAFVFIHFVVLTTGFVASSKASSPECIWCFFNFQYTVVALRSSGSCLHCLPITSIFL